VGGEKEIIRRCWWRRETDSAMLILGRCSYSAFPVDTHILFIYSSILSSVCSLSWPCSPLLLLWSMVGGPIVISPSLRWMSLVLDLVLVSGLYDVVYAVIQNIIITIMLHISKVYSSAL
jgi:hypothetical protein